MIPKLVHQTFIAMNLPDFILSIIEMNKKLNPNYEFIFYDDQQCKQFIQTHFSTRTYNAYISINDCYGAMKADFFRYCVLYILGGIYLDIKSILHVDLDTIITRDDICILDIPRTNLEYWRVNHPTYEQWILFFSPQHPYLKEMIQDMTEAIEQKSEPIGMNSKKKILHITGPDAFARVIHKYNTIHEQILHRNIDYNLYFNLTSHKHNYIEMYTMNNKKHYNEYTESLYKDDNNC